jgi:hypothetical protein
LNHRPPGPEPESKKSLSRRPGVTSGVWNNPKSPSNSQPFATGLKNQTEEHNLKTGLIAGCQPTNYCQTEVRTATPKSP